MRDQQTGLMGYFNTGYGLVPILQDGEDDITIIALSLGTGNIEGIFNLNEIKRAKKLIQRRLKHPHLYSYLIVLEDEQYTRDFGFFLAVEKMR